VETAAPAESESEESVAIEEATEDTTEEEPQATEEAEEEIIADESSPACMTQLEAMLNEEGESNIPDDAPEDLDEEYILVTYQVSGDEISAPKNESDIPEELIPYQQDAARHKELWEFYTKLIPAERRTIIGEFVIFSDGAYNVIGAVDEASTPGKWTLEMDAIDSLDVGMLSTTLVHEFAHMLTLDDTQIDDTASTCADYQTIDGCSKKDSYINDFYNAFWADIYDEWSATVMPGGEVNEDEVVNFYDKYPDQFVSDYAPTGPEEDIAESWIYFVFSEKPAGDTIAEQKILFFYNYPELVSLRQYTLNGICKYTE
jgi:hypothetical protein